MITTPAAAGVSMQEAPEAATSEQLVSQTSEMAPLMVQLVAERTLKPPDTGQNRVTDAGDRPGPVGPAADGRTGERQIRVPEQLSESKDLYQTPRSVTSRELFRNHSAAITELSRLADGGPEADARLNTSTYLVASADRRLAQQAVTDAETVLERHGSALTSNEQRVARARLRDARQLVATEPAVTESTSRSTLQRRAEAVQGYGAAWAQANRVVQLAAESTPTTVEITSEYDPIRDGKNDTTRRIAGVVRGIQSDQIENVTLRLNGERRVETTLNASEEPLGNTTFAADVTLTQRLTTVTATVETSRSVEGEESDPDGDEDVSASGDDGGSESDTRVMRPKVVVSDTDTGAVASVIDGDDWATLNAAFDDSVEAGGVRVSGMDFELTGYDTVFHVGLSDPATTAGVPALDDATPLRYVEVTTEDLSPQTLDRAPVYLTVSESALPAGATFDDVVVYRYDVTRWEEVDTRHLGDGRFRASLSGLSTFVVAVDAPATPTETATQSPAGAGGGNTATSTPRAATATATDVDDSTEFGFGLGGDSGLGWLGDLLDRLLRAVLPGTAQPPALGTVAVWQPIVSTAQQPALEDVRVDAGPTRPATNGSETRTVVAATDTVKFDGDGLPEEYETNVLGTDPLDPDSNSTTMSSIRGDNGVVDGLEDAEDDSVVNAQEFVSGTDPTTADTDGDGLDDFVELAYNQFDPRDPDTDDDGVKDSLDDADGDGLDTLAELENGTNPTMADTDADGVGDAEEGPNGIDPLDADTDDDGLLDGEELDLGTNPRVADTDGDGVTDDDEQFTTSTRNETAGAAVDITAPGDASQGVTIRDVTATVFDTEAVENARVSPVIDFESEQPFSSANVTIEYDESRVETDESNLAVFHFNESLGTFVPMNSTVDAESNTVTANTTHFSKFAVFSIPKFKQEFTVDTPDSKSGTGELTPVDTVFVIDSSGSMAWNDPSGFRKTAAKEFVGALLDIDRAAVVDFDGRARVVRGLTANLDAVNRSIDSLDASGGTNIGDGLRTANKHFARESSDDRAKITILLTDGRGSGGRYEAQTAAEQNISIYTIGLSNANDAKLRDIASTTGGSFNQVQEASELPEVFSRVAEEATKATDSDNDGLSDAVESMGFYAGAEGVIQTDPHDPDTDNDGIEDGAEVGDPYEDDRTFTVNGQSETITQKHFRLKSDPLEVDSDEDGLTDRMERQPTQIRVADDREDAQAAKAILSMGGLSGTDVDDHLDTVSVTSDPLMRDTDDDGIEDGREQLLGTNPNSDDTDDDGIGDEAELEDYADEDPTLFDTTAPTVEVHSIRTKTVKNDNPKEVLDRKDTKYTVQLRARDPSGVQRLNISRESATTELTDVTTGDDGATPVYTLSVVADSYFAQAGQHVLGPKITVGVSDTHGNADEVGRRDSSTISKFAGFLGKLDSNAFPILTLPVGVTAMISGFVYALSSGVVDIVDFVWTHLKKKTKQRVSFMRNFVDSPFEAVKDKLLNTVSKTFGMLMTMVRMGYLLMTKPGLVAGSIVDETFKVGAQKSQNPFGSLPYGSSNILDLRKKQALKFVSGNDDVVKSPKQFLAGGAHLNPVPFRTPDNATFAGGFYTGVIVLNVVIELLIKKGAGYLTSVGGRLGAVATKLDDANVVKRVAEGFSTASDALGAMKLVTRGAETFKAGVLPWFVIVAGLGDYPKPRQAALFTLMAGEVAPSAARAYAFGPLTADMKRTLKSAVQITVATDANYRHAVRYFARTGKPGVDLLGDIDGVDPIAGLVAPETSATTQRMLATGVAEGAVTVDDAEDALTTYEALEEANAARMDAVLTDSGTTGVSFFAAAGTDTSRSFLSLVDSRGITTTELEQYVVRTDGQGRALLSALSESDVRRLFEMDGTYAHGARAGLADAVEAGSLTGAEVTAYIDATESMTIGERRATLRNVSTANTTDEVVAELQRVGVATSGSSNQQLTTAGGDLRRRAAASAQVLPATQRMRVAG